MNLTRDMAVAGYAGRLGDPVIEHPTLHWSDIYITAVPAWYPDGPVQRTWLVGEFAHFRWLLELAGSLAQLRSDGQADLAQLVRSAEERLFGPQIEAKRSARPTPCNRPGQAVRTTGFGPIGKKHRYKFVGRSAGWLWFNHIYPDGLVRLMIVEENRFWDPAVKP